jgi:chemotaxis protein CheC
MNNKDIRKLGNEHLDILKEVANIGAGHAATALSQLLGKQIGMAVPNVYIARFDEICELAEGAETLIASVYIQISGDLSANMFFVLSKESADHLLSNIVDNYNDTGETDDFIRSALEEIGNILIGSYISSLSDFTGLSLNVSVPSLSIDMAGAILSEGLFELGKYGDFALTIDTAIYQASGQIQGHFFFFLDPPSFAKLFHALGVPWE